MHGKIANRACQSCVRILLHRHDAERMWLKKQGNSRRVYGGGRTENCNRAWLLNRSRKKEASETQFHCTRFLIRPLVCIKDALQFCWIEGHLDVPFKRGIITWCTLNSARTPAKLNAHLLMQSNCLAVSVSAPNSEHQRKQHRQFKSPLSKVNSW